MISQEILNSFNRRKEISLFNPKSVSGIAGWWDIADGTSVTLDSSYNISQLNDKSGNSHNLTQATSGSRPAFNLVGNNAGIPFISLSSTKSIAGTLTVSQPFTIYMVIRQKTIANHANLIQLGDGTMAITQLVSTATSSGSVYNCTGYVADVAWKQQYNPNTYNTGWMLYRVVFNGDNSGIELGDGPQSPGLNAIGAYSWNGGTAGISAFIVGGDNNTFDFSESIVYSGVVGEYDDKSIKQYLMNKHAIINPDYYAFNGDSITEGNQDGYANVLSLAKGKLCYNYGVSSTGVVYPSNAKNLLGVFDLSRQAIHGTHFFMYGTNDYAGDASWKAHYKGFISRLIARGVPKNKIILITPPYGSGISAFYTGLQADTAAICSELGVVFCDYATWSKNNSPDTLTVDGKHLNYAGSVALSSMLSGFVN